MPDTLVFPHKLETILPKGIPCIAAVVIDIWFQNLVSWVYLSSCLALPCPAAWSFQASLPGAAPPGIPGSQQWLTNPLISSNWLHLDPPPALPCTLQYDKAVREFQQFKWTSFCLANGRIETDSILYENESHIFLREWKYFYCTKWLLIPPYSRCLLRLFFWLND